jgi:hypothetical protein
MTGIERMIATEAASATQDAALRWVLERMFRTNAAYRLIRHEDLADGERRTFAPLAQATEHYGVLVPAPGAGLGVQAVDRDAAKLLLGLATAGNLPDSLRASERPDTNRRIALLVMDGVLEIERDGAFLTGPRAHKELLRDAHRNTASTNAIGRLSDEALRRAQVLPINEPDRLNHWLYSYGSIPVGPMRARELGSWTEIERFAGIDTTTLAGRLLREHYVRSAPPGWMSWQHVEQQLQHVEADGKRPAFKLYVSPMPASLAEVMPVLIDCLVQRQVAAFKMGRDARGVLRPDKIVVYFDDIEALHEVAAMLAPRIAGAPSQGVPFTAALDDAGLLSWGIDPPRNRRIPGWRGSESWRVWITERLARALLRARVIAGDESEPRLAALDRIRAEGIDPAVWLPPESLWQDEQP